MAQRITKSNKGVMSILSRLIKYMFEYYKLPLIIVLHYSNRKTDQFRGESL